MFQLHNVIPDIVTIGKPMGNGYPVAAVVCKRHIADVFASTGIEYFNTFGGNSVACYIADAVLDTIINEKLQENALIVGKYLKEKLTILMGQYPCIVDVRGCGLFLGVEFVSQMNGGSLSTTNKGEWGPDGLESCCLFTKRIIDHMQQHACVIASRDDNVMKIKPPLVFGHKEAAILLGALENALSCCV